MQNTRNVFLLFILLLSLLGCISIEPAEPQEKIQQSMYPPFESDELAPHAYDSKDWSFMMPHTIVHKCKPEMLEPIDRELHSKGYAVIHREYPTSGNRRADVGTHGKQIGAEYVLQTDTVVVYYAHPPRNK